MSNIGFIKQRPKLWKLGCKSYQEHYLLSYFRVYCYYFFFQSSLMHKKAINNQTIEERNLKKHACISQEHKYISILIFLFHFDLYFYFSLFLKPVTVSFLTKSLLFFLFVIKKYINNYLRCKVKTPVVVYIA